MGTTHVPPHFACGFANNAAELSVSSPAVMAFQFDARPIQCGFQFSETKNNIEEWHFTSYWIRVKYQSVLKFGLKQQTYFSLSQKALHDNSVIALSILDECYLHLIVGTHTFLFYRISSHSSGICFFQEKQIGHLTNFDKEMNWERVLLYFYYRPISSHC